MSDELWFTVRKWNGQLQFSLAYYKPVLVADGVYNKENQYLFEHYKVPANLITNPFEWFITMYKLDLPTKLRTFKELMKDQIEEKQ